MAPPNIKDQLPLLNKVVRWFHQQGLIIDSPIFRLHHQATSFILMLGFLFISVENYLDTKSIVCHNNASPYAKSYCWIHGYSYVDKSLQGTKMRYLPLLELGNSTLTIFYFSSNPWMSRGSE